MFYRINWHAGTKRVLLESAANAAPAALVLAGSISIGTFEHDDEGSTATNPIVGRDDNHVLYQHVQEALYKIGIQDMQSVAIFKDLPKTLSLGSGALSVKVGETTAKLPLTGTPPNAELDVVYTSSDPTKATVNPIGVVKGVSAGEVTITAKARANEAVVATRVVTVTA